MTTGRAFVKDRLAACRSLDESVFQKFADKWKIPQPRVWQTDARLILMHKTRVCLDITGFTKEERQISRDWLADRGYSETTKYDGKPCPECGGTTGKPTFAGCSTCGRGQ